MSRFSNLPKVKAVTVTVTLTGTPVQYATSVNVPTGIEVLVMAHPDNTGRISVAESSANALNTGSSNFPLEPSQTVGFLVRNLQNLWFDSTVSGDKVVLCLEKE